MWESCNSQGEMTLELFSKLFFDLCAHFPLLSKELARDHRALKRRYRDEGLAFMTTALPRLGKALEHGLDVERFVCPDGFHPAADSKLPLFLGGLFSNVFSTDGSLLPSPCIRSITALLQLCYFVYKLELAYPDSLKEKVLSGFIQAESEIDDLRDFDTLDWGPGAREVVQCILREVDFESITPRHGPGAVATGERGDAKWTPRRLYSAIHAVYPYSEYYYVDRRHVLDSAEDYISLPVHKAGCAKVVLVPKDSRGPRLISCEPLEYQYIQQGQAKALTETLQDKHWLSRGQVNFRDQSINQRLALESSKSRLNCTIDLKDASDLVSCALVKYLFGEKYRYVDATRSTHTRLPDGTELTLRKFAPMGSAMCFPVESLCFWAIIVGAVSSFTGWTPSRVARSVWVYGDDLICRTEHFELAVRALESAGLRVNRQKSLSIGFYRESCGVFAYKGVDVTPIRLKTVWSGKPGDGSAFVSYTDYANRLQASGYTNVAGYIRELVAATYGRLPGGVRSCGFPCIEFESLQEAVEHNSAMGFRMRLDSVGNIQVKVRTGMTAAAETQLDGWPRLLRNLLSPLDDPEQVVGPSQLKIQTRWRTLRYPFKKCKKGPRI